MLSWRSHGMRSNTGANPTANPPANQLANPSQNDCTYSSTDGTSST
jgi:hypothetical protein